MTDRSLPTRVKLIRQEVVQQVACGKAHSLAVTVHGDLYAWGYGGNGRYGERYGYDGPYDMMDGPMGGGMYGRYGGYGDRYY